MAEKPLEDDLYKPRPTEPPMDQAKSVSRSRLIASQYYSSWMKYDSPKDWSSHMSWKSRRIPASDFAASAGGLDTRLCISLPGLLTGVIDDLET
jgi:hypothetical protein